MKKIAATLDLKYPIEWGNSQVISRLEFRRVKTKDLRETSDLGEIESGLHILGNLTGLTPSQVDDLDGEDLTAALEIVAGFLPKSRGTGNKQ